tara:strand:+ start:3313 stop:3462 length:150 start_codon:yes stop_codon:yes gene_type:complete
MSWYLVGAEPFEDDKVGCCEGKFSLRGAEPSKESSEVCLSLSSLMRGIV